MRVVSLALILCVAAENTNPVERVVGLLQGLKAKITADGKGEQVTYDKFACWCETTTGRKQSAIADAKELIEELSTEILQQKGRLGSFGADVANLKKQIAENKEAQNEAESLRKKENEDYLATKSALEQAIANLGKAIQVLGAGTASKGASHLSGKHPEIGEVQMMTVVAGVRSAMSLYSRRNKDDMNLRKEDFASVKTFLSTPTAWVQTSSPHKGEYTTQSSAIQGMLADMHDSFQRDLADAIETEGAKLGDFTSLMVTKRGDLTLLESTLVNNEVGQGDDSANLATNKQAREETQKQLDTDEAFLETTLESCKNKADECSERSRLRAEELAGINQAVDILTSDEAKASFSKADTTFVQVSATESDQKRTRVVNTLKRTAKMSQNVRLALIASRVSTTVEGHFGALIEDIEKMMQKLRDEEQDDLDKKDWCESERSKSNSINEQLENEKSNLDKKMLRNGGRVTELNAEHTKTQDEMDQLKLDMADALTLRNTENTEFKEAILADSQSITLLGSAIAAVSKFYAKNAFVQTGKQPEYTQDEDVAPEASFSGASSHGTESGGVVSLMGMIKEDMVNEMKVAREEEATAEAEYRKLLKESEDSTNAMEQKCVDLKAQIAGLGKETADVQAVYDDKQSSKEATDTYLLSIKPECDWMMGKFDDRATARTTELAGLEDAKGQLAGMKTASLVTKKRALGKRVSVEDEMNELDKTEKELGMGRDVSFLQRH